jgi:hypothetical protein
MMLTVPLIGSKAIYVYEQKKTYLSERAHDDLIQTFQ